MANRVRLSVLLAVVALAGATACGDDNSGGTGSGSGGSGGGMTVKIVEPAEASTVQIPFTLKLESSVPLGSTKSGNHHVHLFFDGDDSKYEVIESDNVEVSDQSPAVAGLAPGQHELNVSLRNADHSAAGVETKVMVQVGEGGGGSAPPTGSTGYSGGGGGGY